MKKEKENAEISQIKQDLLDQLLEQGKIGKHFGSLVDDYINFEKLKRKMQKDIDSSFSFYLLAYAQKRKMIVC